MDLIKNNFLRTLLIILMYFSANKSDTSQKSVICVVKKGLTNIQQLPPECTCIASYLSNHDTGPDEIQVLRKDRELQHLLIIDDYEYYKIYLYLRTGLLQTFVDLIDDKIKTFSANGVLFNKMISSFSEIAPSGHPEGIFQKKVRELFVELRKRNDGLVIGLSLSTNSIALNNAFSQDSMGPYVDFFVTNTISYYICLSKMEDANTINIAPINEIISTLDMTNGMGFSNDQLIFIIQLVVKTAKFRSAHVKDDTSYSDMCSADHKFSKYRRFCVETLPNFYQKGLLVNDRKMKGVIVQSVDHDDYVPNCGPIKFPVMQAIKAGMYGLPEPTGITQEPNWATLAKDRN